MSRYRLVPVLFCAWVLWASGWFDAENHLHTGLIYYEAFETKAQCEQAKQYHQLLWTNALMVARLRLSPEGQMPVSHCLPSAVDPKLVLGATASPHP